MEESPKKKRRTGKRILRAVFLAIGILLGASLFFVLVGKWIYPPLTMTQVGNMMDGYGLHKTYVPWKDISRNVKLAALASEDQLFPEHGGFDWHSIDKSLNGPKKKKRVRGGGASTISQQTAKNAFLWQGTGITRYIRKVPEFYFTQLIEWVWGKQRILEVYLNIIEMGPGIFGVEAASETYFHKHARDLTRAEAAQIIACLPNPKKFTVKPMSHRVSWRYPQIMVQMDNLDGDEDVDALIKTP